MQTFEAITTEEIRASQATLAPKAIGWALDNLDYLNRPMTLLGTSQKVEKGRDKAHVYVMYLAPASKVSRVTLCAGAKMAGCEKDCLISSGHLGRSQGQRAATKRTILFLLRPQWFKGQLLREIAKAERKAVKEGIPAAFRLNGTSDIDWREVIEAAHDSQFYDYTKVPARLKDVPANYDLTFSGSMAKGAARRALGAAVGAGHRVALAWNTKESKGDTLSLPKALGDREVVSFDTTDLRFLDAKGSIGHLTSKGTNAAYRESLNSVSNTFWVTESNVGDLADIIAKA